MQTNPAAQRIKAAAKKAAVDNIPIIALGKNQENSPLQRNTTFITARPNSGASASSEGSVVVKTAAPPWLWARFKSN